MTDREREGPPQSEGADEQAGEGLEQSPRADEEAERRPRAAPPCPTEKGGIVH